MGLGIGYLLREVYFSYTFPPWVADATLQFLPRWVRGVLFIGVATGATMIRRLEAQPLDRQRRGADRPPG